MNKKLERYRQLRDKKKARLEKAQKDMDRLEQMVQDEENTQIVAAVRRRIGWWASTEHGCIPGSTEPSSMSGAS